LLPVDCPAGAWSAVAGAVPELVVEAGPDEEGAGDAVEPGVDAGADCPAAGASWARTVGIAARMTPATAAATIVALKRRARAGVAGARPGATKVPKFADLPVDLILRLTFICHGASGRRNPRLLRPVELAQQSPYPWLGTHLAMPVANH
jgi:hypothetical protein